MFKKGKLFHRSAGLIILLVLALLLSACSSSEETEDALVMSHQSWTESYIMGDLVRILIEENTDIPLEIAELDSFNIQWAAYEAGEIDLWPTYTSSPYINILGDDGLRESDAVYNHVKTELQEQYDLTVMSRLGFYNNYDLAVRPEIAEQYNIVTYSDLAAVSDELIIAGDVNFTDTPAALPLLQEKYGMEFKDVKNVGVTLKWPVIEAGEADVISCYTTDAQIHNLGLVVLVDDMNAMPRYDACVLVRTESLDKFAELEETLEALAGQMSNAEMAELNARVELDGEDSAVVAREFLQSKGLID